LRVFIADDSILIRNIVKEMLLSTPDIVVVGEASNGADAVSRALALNPDIVIMDIDMPIMNGLEATKRLSEATNIPILVFTHNTDPELPFKALNCGAVDFLLKPDFGDLNRPDYVSNFVQRLYELTLKKKNSVIHEFIDALPDAVSQAQAIHPAMVVIGASTGGPQAVLNLIKSLPLDFSLPIALVQHIETGFDKGYADWLASETGHQVALAVEGDTPAAGRVYVSPTDTHLMVVQGHFHLDDGPKVVNQKPSVDILFQSAANFYGNRLVGVLLTGMGTDGANGCKTIRERGGVTVVQNQASSLVFGMPKAAIERGAASIVLPLDEMGACLLKLCGDANA
jgi:two-component system, chemotaxis family, protein-glutamate methylesterase/glutaminase